MLHASKHSKTGQEVCYYPVHNTTQSQSHYAFIGSTLIKPFYSKIDELIYFSGSCREPSIIT